MSSHDSEPLSRGALKVQQALTQAGLTCRVLELEGSTRTSEEAATALGCAIGQIAKSLVFKGKKSKTPFLVVASGPNRVDERRLKDLVGEQVSMARPEFVREITGYAIGGVPPIGHDHPLTTFIDEDLFQFDRIWAAAGTPNAMFELTPKDLEGLTRGQTVPIKK